MKRAAGFTMIELIVVMVLIGILAAIGIPKMMSTNAIEPVALRDQVSSGFRYAQKAALAHRRLVCATRTGFNISFALASAAGSSVCDTTLPIGITGSSAITFDSVIVSTLFFQPDGTVTSDAAGATSKSGTVTITGDGSTYSIKVEGATGYVD